MNETVKFYEKPGCAGNREQQRKLMEAGYKLEIVDMLSTRWNKDELLQYFEGKSIHECINLRAPLITSGELDPSQLGSEELLEQMIKIPILIKRPLISFRGEYGCGFESPLVAKLLGEAQAPSKCKMPISGTACTPE